MPQIWSKEHRYIGLLGKSLGIIECYEYEYWIIPTKLIYFVLNQTGYENIAKLLIENNANVDGLLDSSAVHGNLLQCLKYIIYIYNKQHFFSKVY